MITLNYNGQLFEVSDSNKTILEVLEENQIKVNVQCRQGICGTCRCKLVNGVSSYKHLPLAMMHSDEILICIAKANNNIEINKI